MRHSNLWERTGQWNGFRVTWFWDLHFSRGVWGGFFCCIAAVVGILWDHVSCIFCATDVPLFLWEHGVNNSNDMKCGVITAMLSSSPLISLGHSCCRAYPSLMIKRLVCTAWYHQLNFTQILVGFRGMQFTQPMGSCHYCSTISRKRLNKLLYLIMSGQKPCSIFICTAIHIYSFQCLSNTESWCEVPWGPCISISTFKNYILWCCNIS